MAPEVSAALAAACQLPDGLRCISYLCPSLPEDLFRLVAGYLSQTLQLPAGLELETRVSAPIEGEPDPFGLNQADLGFVCSTAVARASNAGDGFELLGCAPVFRHARGAGRPVYYADVIVRSDRPISSPDELEGMVWAYNDSSSLSGFYALLQFLREQGRGLEFFRQLVCSGSHLRSLDLVLEGKADAAALDSTVLALQLRQRPELRSRLRVVASWGPFQVQPIIVRRSLPAATKDAIRQALLAMAEQPGPRSHMDAFMLQGFAPVELGLYAEERGQIEECQRAFGNILERQQ